MPSLRNFCFCGLQLCHHPREKCIRLECVPPPATRHHHQYSKARRVSFTECAGLRILVTEEPLRVLVKQLQQISCSEVGRLSTKTKHRSIEQFGSTTHRVSPVHSTSLAACARGFFSCVSSHLQKATHLFDSPVRVAQELERHFPV